MADSKGNKYLVIIAGPTAVGKSSMAIEIAKYFRTEIISADSRQCFKEMSIGTAKPSKEELKVIPHHFIDCLSVEDHYTAGDYEKEYLALLSTLFEKRDLLVLTGGTGLYIDALCEGFDEFPKVDEAHLNFYKEKFRNEGIGVLQNLLLEQDPGYAKIVDMQNAQRLIRALSVIKSSGQAFSSFLNKEKVSRQFSIIPIVLEMDRVKLYDRINLRIDKMIKTGLVEEAKALFHLRHLNALQTVGYKELFEFFAGEINQEEAIALIKRNSRRYAKRQMTWFRKKQWKNFAYNDKLGILEYIKNKVKS